MNREKRQVGVRFLTVLLAAALLVSLSTGVLAASLQEGAEGSGEAPVVTVVAVGTDKAAYLELGLSLDSRTNNLQSVGAVLKFDLSYLTPAGWSEGATSDLSKAKGWESAEAIPVKGPDGLSGKTALAWQKNNTAYLYLSAESPAVTKLSQTLPQADKTEGDSPADETVTGSDGVTTWKKTAECKDPVDQAVTVRLALREPGEGETAQEVLEKAVQSIALETGKMAESSPLGDASGVLWLGGTDGAGAPALVGYTYVQSGATVFAGGGGDLSGVIPVVFYDWDGLTLLGSTIVNKSDTEEEVREAIRQYTATMMSPDNAAAYLDKDFDPNGDLEDFYSEEHPLSNKKGYTFGLWMDFDSQEFTSYGEVVNINSYYQMDETMPAPGEYDLTGLENKSSIAVKAAYKTNTKLDKNSDLYKNTNGYSVNDRQYTIVPTSFTRFGNGEDYSLSIEITRQNLKGDGVYRARKMGLKVSMTVYDSQKNPVKLYSLLPLDNKDSQTVEVAVNSSSVINISVVVVDLGNVSNWATGSTDRSTSYSIGVGTVGPGTDGTGDGYLIKGCLGQLNGLAREYLNSDPPGSAVDNTHFTTPGFSVSAGNVYIPEGSTASGPSGRRQQALRNIIAMYKSVIEKEGRERDLDWHEINDAIRYGSTYPDYIHP